MVYYSLDIAIAIAIAKMQPQQQQQQLYQHQVLLNASNCVLQLAEKQMTHRRASVGLSRRDSAASGSGFSATADV